DKGVLKGDGAYITRIGAIMLGVALPQVVTAIGATVLSARTTAAVGRDLRSAVFRKVLDLSAREVGHFGTPSLITRTVNDVGQVEALTLTTFDTAVSALIMCVGGLGMALYQDVPLSLLLVVMVVLVGVCIAVVLGRLGPLYDRMQDRVDRLTQLLREQIGGVRVVRAFVRDTHERERFHETNSALFGLSLRVGRLMATLPIVLLVVMNGLTVALVWFAGKRVDAGALQLGALSALLSYLALIIMSFVMGTMVFVAAPRGRVSARRIQEVLDAQSSVVEPTTPLRTFHTTGHLDVWSARFGYEGAREPVLHGIDLVARPGQTIAIVGSTGSGKTTLLNLVRRQFDVTGGSVRVNGIDVRDITSDVLTRIVGVVPQIPHLFSGTIATNLRYGDPLATDEELWRVLEIAQARTFVEHLPDGLSAPVSHGGSNLSGGQRQRLSIARTLLRRPEIYLLDDCFSALDHGTEAALRAALAPEISSATVIVVTQRIDTVHDADHVVVMDSGRVVGAGTHTELLRSNETYREIALSQSIGEQTPEPLVTTPQASFDWWMT
ncbi:MAG: ABC transporter ATP-binding protein, partial [Umezawaea sp.]